ncbi:BCCT family transporter [Cumulibacter soli]|uniref:BCCT family transporter n=1 Tax=Cumulibacter soli TaxID=2546344 RepID=UPI001067934E|nr:BCCT family transporter [Cumulibacter soli]
MSSQDNPPAEPIDSDHSPGLDDSESEASPVVTDRYAGLPESVHLPPAIHLGEDDTDEAIVAKLRSHGVRLGRGLIAPAVFWPALLVILAIAIVAVAAPDFIDSLFTSINDWIVANLGWYYMLVVSGFVVVAIAIGLSRLGKIPLGRDGEQPEFSVLTWFAMLFAAGMGIGLVFYGVGEPLTYATVDPKPGWDGSQSEISALAMAQTFVHWGLHPWAIYAIIGLALGYAIHRRGRPVSIRWALEPLFGERVKGRLGDLIDVLAIFGTVFGVATSLGLGVQQISSGMAHLGIVDAVDNVLLVVLIIVITLLATTSVISGLGAGIKWLSNINLSFAGVLLISMLLLGPTIFLLQNFVESIGVYLANLLQMSFDVGAFERGEGAADWFSGWTVFYWGWWISWSPFVGVFIARISRGRTVRQFIAGVLLVPTIVGFLWFSVLGGTGIFNQMYGGEDYVTLNADGEEVIVAEQALFDVLGGLPLGQILSVLAIVLVAIFFITSSDSASLVVDMLASGGHPNPPMWSRVLWALLEGAIAAALLLAGGLGALQAAALATALPFSVVLILMAWANIKALRVDAQIYARDQRDERLARVSNQIADALPKHPGFESYVDDRIDYRISRSRGLLRRNTPQK